MSRLISNIIDLIDQKQNILLSSHVGPDGDSLGSQMAFYLYLKSLGKNVWIYNEGHIPHYFSNFTTIEQVVTEPDKWLVPESGFDLAIIFECTSLDRIGDVKNLVSDGMEIINIDHHLENGEYGRYNYVDTGASSVGEMILRIFKRADFLPDINVATFLYIAILTDTGRFHFSSTTPDALRAAADLVEVGLDVKDITDKIYYCATKEQMRLTTKVVADMELFYDNQVCILTLRRSALNKYGLKYGDVEGLVEWTMRIKGVKIGALLKDKEDNFTKISLRSQGNMDVYKLAQFFNGGGHMNAAGCQIETDLDSAKEQLVNKIKELL